MAVDPKRAEEGLSELISLYREAQREIAAQASEAMRSGEIQRRTYRTAAYQRIVNYLERVGVQADPVARRLIENAWREGDRSILRAVNPDMLGFTFDVINRDAMEEMQRALTSSLFDARRTVGRQTFDVFRRAGLRSTALGLLGASGSRRTASDNMRRRLERRGIKGFVDKSGREWSLRSYTQMVARTTTREAVTAAQLSRMADQGIELARISSSGNPCPLCAEWQERLISLDGSRDTFNGEPVWGLGDVPNGGPPFHPNCRHYWSPESVLFSGTRERGPSQQPAKPGSNLDEWRERVQPTRGLGPSGGAHVDRALDAIASVHGPRNIPRVEVQRETRRGVGGWFARGTTRTGVNPSWSNGASAYVHELGHVLDFYDLGKGAVGKQSVGLFASEAKTGPIAKIVDALIDTDEIRAIKEIRDGLTAGERFREHSNYLLRRREIFARAYAQYIAKRSGDKVLLRDLQRTLDLDTLDGLSQWSDDSFERVLTMFDEVFNGD